MNKKFIALMISLVLLTGLFTGCSKTTKTDTESTAATEATTTVDATEAATESQEPVTLTYTSWMTKGEDLPLLDAFMKENPNITVVNTSLDGATYDQLLKTRMIAGETPDVFQIMPNQLAAIVDQGYAVDVTAQPAVALMDTKPTLKSLVTVDGKVYGIPLTGGAGNNWTYYNKKYFAAKGFTEPTTPEELDALLAKIKADNMDTIIVGVKDNWSIQFLEFPVQSLNYATWPGNSGLEMDLKLATGEIKQSDRYKASFTRLEELTKKGYISEAGFSLGWEQACQYLVDGKAGIFMCGNWVPGSNPITNADPAVFELGCFLTPLPVAADGKMHLTTGINQVLMVSSSSKNPIEAMKLFDYLTNPENIIKYVDSIGQDSLVVDIKTNPVFDKFKADVKNSVYQLEFLQGSKLPAAAGANLCVYMANILAGSTAEAELKNLDDDFEKIKSTIDISTIK